MHKEVTALLGRLGLKDRERQIYLTCLKHQDGLFVCDITLQTGIQRSTVDLTIQRLLKRGYIKKIRVGRRLCYFAQAPETILFRQKQLVEDWGRVVPLLASYNETKNETEISYFEGVVGLRQVHQDALLHLKFAEGKKKDLLAFTSGADFVRLFPDHKRAFIDKRVRIGSWYKALATKASTDVPEWQSDKKALREIKYIPDGTLDFSLEIQIYADFVMLYSLKRPIGGVLIHNEKIASSMRSLFYLLWQLLPD